VQCAPACTEELFSILPAAIVLLELGSETLKKVLLLLESYVILSPDMVLQAYARPMMDAFTRLLGELKQDVCTSIMHVVEVILQTCPIQLCGACLIESGFLWKLVDLLLTGQVDI
jgi:hypothetical protein